MASSKQPRQQRAEIEVVNAQGKRVSDREVWATILGDDVAPWDMSTDEYYERHRAEIDKQRKRL
jgi:hypothetical protein